MSFSSIHFIFLFLPAFLFLYFVVPNPRWRNSLLALFSLFFYAWEDPGNIPLLVGSVLLNWCAGLLIEKTQNNKREGLSTGILVAAISINLIALGYYKYFHFIFSELGSLWGISPGSSAVLLPLGISFFTFSAISYLVDVYQENLKAQRNIVHIVNYLAMFPKLIQGPLAQYGQIEPDLLQRKVNVENIEEGIRRIIIGLAKKVLIADTVARVADIVFGTDPNAIGMGVAWYGTIAFAFQIYFDFSGYTDIAIGLGNILGFHLPENFNYPYISRSITDFWRRWHMSLTGWFRTYIFLPLEFKRRREKHFRTQSNLLIIFFLTGLWHGASWNYIIWGVYFGLILAIEASRFGKWLKKIPTTLQHIYSIVLILFGWVLFKIDTLSDWAPFFKALFGGNEWHQIATLRSLNILMYWPILTLALILSTPVLKNMDKRLSATLIGRLSTRFLLISLFISTVAMLIANKYSVFIYRQF
jgi:alginate O-acetyltransferase complex protein AlgI